MVAAENYVLNNECAPNNEVLHISLYHCYMRKTRQYERECQGNVHIAHGDTAWKASYVATTCTSIFELPALVRGFLFVPMWECIQIVSY